MILIIAMMVVVCRPSDSDIVDSVGDDDDDDDVTKPTSASVSHSSKPVTSCSVPQVLRPSPGQQQATVELVNEKPAPAVRTSTSVYSDH